jgi:hypothetical protein
VKRPRAFGSQLKFNLVPKKKVSTPVLLSCEAVKSFGRPLSTTPMWTAAANAENAMFGDLAGQIHMIWMHMGLERNLRSNGVICQANSLTWMMTLKTLGRN